LAMMLFVVDLLGGGFNTHLCWCLSILLLLVGSWGCGWRRIIQIKALGYALFLSLPLFLSVSSLTLSLTLTLSLLLSSLSCSHYLTLALTLALSLALSCSPSLARPLSLALSRSPSLARPLSLALSRSPSLTRPLSLSLPLMRKRGLLYIYSLFFCLKTSFPRVSICTRTQRKREEHSLEP
jgi:hypothetical protein